jgi:hypothetical protein
VVEVEEAKETGSPREPDLLPLSIVELRLLQFWLDEDLI